MNKNYILKTLKGKTTLVFENNKKLPIEAVTDEGYPITKKLNKTQTKLIRALIKDTQVEKKLKKGEVIYCALENRLQLRAKNNVMLSFSTLPFKRNPSSKKEMSWDYNTAYLFWMSSVNATNIFKPFIFYKLTHQILD